MKLGKFSLAFVSANRYSCGSAFAGCLQAGVLSSRRVLRLVMAMRSCALRFLVVIGVLIALTACGIIAFRHAGRWLIHENPLSHSDVILVLSGSMPYRAEEAAKVFRAGYASEIWLTQPVSPAAELRSEEHTSELQSHVNLVCRLLLEKKKK